MRKSDPTKQATWGDLHRGLKDTESYPEILERFREHGGSRDRWSTKDIVAMCHAISYTEDSLETKSRGRDNDERRALKKIRRKLEYMNHSQRNTRLDKQP